jgi:hypothetical protein
MQGYYPIKNIRPLHKRSLRRPDYMIGYRVNSFGGHFRENFEANIKEADGLYCCIISASLILGNKIISPKFIQNNSRCLAWRQLNKARRSALIVS